MGSADLWRVRGPRQLPGGAALRPVDPHLLDLSLPSRAAMFSQFRVQLLERQLFVPVSCFSWAIAPAHHFSAGCFRRFAGPSFGLALQGVILQPSQ